MDKTWDNVNKAKGVISRIKKEVFGQIKKDKKEEMGSRAGNPVRAHLSKTWYNANKAESVLSQIKRVKGVLSQIKKDRDIYLIKQSINVWKGYRAKIASNFSLKRNLMHHVVIGASSCPLCKEYNKGTGAHKCGGCPIKNKTGIEGCKDTPFTEVRKFERMYYEYEDYRIFRAPIFSAHGSKTGETLLKIIDEEILFLESLLPDKSKKIVKEPIKKQEDQLKPKMPSLEEARVGLTHGLYDYAECDAFQAGAKQMYKSIARHIGR